MQSRWRIVVLSLAILSLLAPASAICSPAQPADHGCCASQTQLSAPSCCQPETASQPAAQAPSGNPSHAGFALLPLPVHFINLPQPAMLPSQSSTPPPILLPATILRT